MDKTDKDWGVEMGRRGWIIVLFSILTTLSFSDAVTDMEAKIKKIEREIAQKNTRIKNIDVQTAKLEKQILELERDILVIAKEREKILEDIKTVSKNIEYGSQNLGVTNREMERKKLEFKAKIIAWNRYSKEVEDVLMEKTLLKKDFRNLLYGDLQRMEHIKNVQKDIEKVKANIENEKAKLSNLRNKLASNLKSMDSKKAQQNSLIAKLNREKSGHKQSITKLQKEKARIEKKIKEIIVARAKEDKKVVSTSQAYSKLGKMIKPVAGDIVVRFNEKKQGQVASNGIEIRSKMGTKIKASAKGRVIYADVFQGLGQVVMIDYGYNVIGVYGNLIATSVKLNQQVEQGADIGVLGLSVEGNPNLYYEVRFNLKPIDPVPMFK